MIIGVSIDDSVRMALNEFDGRAQGARDGPAVIAAPVWISFLDVFFTVAFTIELIMRVLAQEGRLLAGVDWKWNVFDLALVLSSLMDLNHDVSDCGDQTNENSSRLPDFSFLPCFQHPALAPPPSS